MSKKNHPMSVMGRKREGLKKVIDRVPTICDGCPGKKDFSFEKCLNLESEGEEGRGCPQLLEYMRRFRGGVASPCKGCKLPIIIGNDNFLSRGTCNKKCGLFVAIKYAMKPSPADMYTSWREATPYTGMDVH